MKRRPTGTKRQRERARRERQEKKAQRKAQRRAERDAAPAAGSTPGEADETGEPQEADVDPGAPAAEDPAPAQ